MVDYASFLWSQGWYAVPACIISFAAACALILCIAVSCFQVDDPSPQDRKEAARCAIAIILLSPVIVFAWPALAVLALIGFFVWLVRIAITGGEDA